MRHLILFMLAVIIACSTSETAAQRVPGDLVIHYAEGGGFTGQWSGAAIAGDGTVRTWTPRLSDSLSTTLGRISASSMKAIWNSIERQKLLDGAGGGEPGNVTRTIVLSSGGKTVEARWSYGTTPSAGTQPYAALYEQCLRAVAEATR